ncbi:hypothetical protein CRG98_012220, partial [Punica granatum]
MAESSLPFPGFRMVSFVFSESSLGIGCLGTFGTVHERLGLSLRSPRSLTLHRVVVGVIVPTSFPPSCRCRCRCSRVSVAHHVQPGHPTLSQLPRLFPSYIEA